MDFYNNDIIQAANDAIKKIFSPKTEVDMALKIAKEENSALEKIEEYEAPTIDIKDTWVWVEGYKATDKDMRCQGFQYELGKKYQIPKDDVKECESGYHMCLNLRDVFKYYHIGHDNRYFRVRALVRLSDKNEYGYVGGITYNANYSHFVYSDNRDKLVAAEIEFLEELSMDEILSKTKAVDWEPKYKELAMKLGIEGADYARKSDILTDYGYSLPFASYLIEHKKYDIAKAVGSQPDLSMDMKCLMILKG